MANYYGGGYNPEPLTEQEVAELITPRPGDTFKAVLQNEGKEIYWTDDRNDGNYQAGLIILSTGEMFGTLLVK